MDKLEKEKIKLDAIEKAEDVDSTSTPLEPYPSTSQEDVVAAPVVRTSRKKQEDKHRKKDPKSWENVSKAIASLNSEEKISFMEKKYQEVYAENRKLSQANHQLTRQYTAMQKERDYTQNELAKSVVARARIENICRELQRQNKQIKEENIAKIKEEEERRKEVSAKFADKLSDINTMMDENKEKSEKLREENIKMTGKLAELYEQFQKREEDISKMSQQLELERQFSQATLAKMELEIKAEKEIHAKEKAILKNNLEKSEANCVVLLETVKGLQDHIDVYKNQYEDFGTTMSKSAKVFDKFKGEIANMTKQVQAAEQESQVWKSKFQDTMKALVEISDMKRNQDLYITGLDKKNEQLQKLCRQIQIDRSNFLKCLKAHGIEPPTNSKEKSPDEETKESPKLTKKEKELQTLKESLKEMQDQLSKINVEEELKATETKTEDEPTSQVTDEDDSAKHDESVQEESETSNKDTSSAEDLACAVVHSVCALVHTVPEEKSVTEEGPTSPEGFPSNDTCGNLNKEMIAVAPGENAVDTIANMPVENEATLV